jgi:deazaflavin-dependent oxidoreductase (nitroreductase family)
VHPYADLAIEVESMVKKYQVNRRVRIINHMMARMIRWNIAPPRTYLLTVRGRKTGISYSNPVTLVEKDGNRWYVSPYGNTNWVKNARAAGEVSLFRSGKTETFKIQEVDAQENPPILKEYITREGGIVRPFFEAQPDSPLEDFEAEAVKPPGFFLEAK